MTGNSGGCSFFMLHCYACGCKFVSLYELNCLHYSPQLPVLNNVWRIHTDRNCDMYVSHQAHQDIIICLLLFQEVSVDKFENSVSAPGEQALRYTKELREQKIRLKEIDQQLDDIEQRNSITPRSLSCFRSMLSESS